MTRRPGDPNPDPPGGRAAKRLEMFEQARAPKSSPQKPPTTASRSRAPKPSAARKKTR
jgi:hypothetical protein